MKKINENKRFESTKNAEIFFLVERVRERED